MPASVGYSVYMGPIANMGAGKAVSGAGFISEIDYLLPTDFLSSSRESSVKQRGWVAGQACVRASGGAAASKAG
jgi:hypothetical protein